MSSALGSVLGPMSTNYLPNQGMQSMSLTGSVMPSLSNPYIGQTASSHQTPLPMMGYGSTKRIMPQPPSQPYDLDAGNVNKHAYDFDYCSG